MSEPENGSDRGNGEKSQDEAGHKPAPKTVPELKPEPKSKSKAREWVEERADATWKNLLKNHLWQRMLKNTLATTITVILALIPAVVAKYGKATYLAPITTVFGHPGRRFGQMAEALILTLLGTLIGTAWSTLGTYLSSLIYGSNEPAAYTIKGLFLVVVVLTHGFLRSHTPRLFIMVLLMIIVSVVSLTGQTVAVSSTLVTTLLYPILTAVGILLIVNICIFPEFSSSFLGITTIETLGETVGALRDAGKYFIQTEATPEVRPKPEVEGEVSNAEAPTAAEEPAEGNAPKPSSVMNKIMAGIGLVRRNKEDTKPPENKAPKVIKLKSLTDEKSSLRKKLDSCKDAQDECNFELAFAVLPPRDLKTISDTAMKKLVANTIALIGVCESKYALIGDQDNSDADEEKEKEKEAGPTGNADTSRGESPVDESSAGEKEKEEDEEGKLEERKKKKKSKTRLERQIADLELVKPHKEIEFGDITLLRLLVQRVSGPVRDLQENIDRTVDVISSCLAYCYDVPKLPDGSRPPRGIKLEEIDIWADTLKSAIDNFDRDSESALEGATSTQNLDGPQIDIMPRIETFLISSFILNLRQAAIQTHQMLTHSRKLVEKRQARHDRRRVYAPKLQWRKWLTSGGEQDMMALPSKGRKDARTGSLKESSEGNTSTANSEVDLLKKPNDEEAAIKRDDTPPSKPATQGKLPTKTTKYKGTVMHRIRNHLADAIEWTLSSEDVLYSLKLSVSVFLVTWPAFLSAWNYWYYSNRGLWAALQLVLITEVAIGNSIFVFILRAVGTTLGCLWGWAAYEARGGNRVVCIVILVIGIIPSTYVQLGTKYVKAGMVAIVSMSVVALATQDQTVTGTATEIFLKRWIAFLIGGIVALLVEFVLFPVRARDRLVESLAASIRHISDMEACLACGIESETNVDVRSPEITERFESAKTKAQSALTAAETFLPFCTQEPRLKGSFAGLALVYTEILFVLHQIVDKMDNMLQLRTEYGSSVVEELNAQVYPYRRNLAGSVTLILFAVHEALTTKLPLPQFLPSARLAHVRVVNRVREVVLNNVAGPMKGPGLGEDSLRSQIVAPLVKRVVQRKFLSWNAASGGQTEVIEYLEELIDLTKLLVGANEFRSGMLMRPTFREYVERIGKNTDGHTVGLDKTMQGGGAETDSVIQREQAELRDEIPERQKVDSLRKRTVKKMDNQAGKVSGVKKVKNADEADRQKRAEEEELPRSLQRVRTRRFEERMERPEMTHTREREAQQRSKHD
jgi:Putative ER transporter, 6TM, N-terminal/Fusaric acid resistance protein-like